MPVIMLTDEQGELLAELLEREADDLEEEGEREDLQEVYRDVLRQLRPEAAA